MTARRVFLEFVRSALKSLEELDSAPVEQAAAAASGDASMNGELESGGGAASVAADGRRSVNLPPLIKLAHADSTEVKRYQHMLAKKFVFEADDR